MNQLTYQKKRIILIAALILFSYFAYQLSFKHALTAFKLNRELQREQENMTNFDGSLAQVNQTNTYYNAALKSYQVKKEDRENRLWRSVSEMALANDLDISFVPNLLAATDTLSTQKGLVKNEFTFKGNYFNLVKLLDTISTSHGIGKISSLKLNTKKDGRAGNNELVMQVWILGIER